MTCIFLSNANCATYSSFIDVLRKRKLHKDPVNSIALVQFADFCHQFLFCDLLGKSYCDAVDADFRGSLRT